MEKELNIAAILKDKPQGTRLYDLLYNIDVKLDTISTTDTETVVWCTNETDNNTTCHRGYSEFGTVRNCPNGLQILLPSRGMRDWRKFAWKKGDVLVSNDGDRHIIFKGFSKDDYTAFEGKHWVSVSKRRHISYLGMQNTQDYHIEYDKDAAQIYINTIEKKLGGKLNMETLEIEKAQPEFKDGDIVVYGKSVAICRKIYKNTIYFYVSIDETFGLLFDDNDVSAEGYRFATEEEKQRLFSALEKKNKRWNPNTKQIEDLPKKCEFKPFDKVLVRDFDDKEWKADFFSHNRLVDDSDYYFSCVGNMWRHCIPYNEETKHLLGTTDEWKGGK